MALALRRNPSSVFLHQLPRHPQPYPRSNLLFGAKEGLEDPRQMLRVDPRPVILHRQHRLVPFPPDMDRKARVPGSYSIRRIRNQIRRDLAKLMRRDRHAHIRLIVALHLHVLRLETVAEDRQHFIHHTRNLCLGHTRTGPHKSQRQPRNIAQPRQFVLCRRQIRSCLVVHQRA